MGKRLGDGTEHVAEVVAIDELAGLESSIASGMQTFVEVGRALQRIRDGKLFRERGFTSFGTYCRDRWDMTPQYANRLIAAPAIVERLETIVS